MTGVVTQVADELFPEAIPPMLAAAGSVPAGPGWLFEFKYDGVRAVAYVDGGRHRLLSRNTNDLTGGYPELGELPAVLGGRRAILDGEIVALEAGERPSFSRLQQRMHVTDPAPGLVAAVPVRYYVFDLLHLDGADLLDLPYRRRRAMLAELGLSGEQVVVPAVFPQADGAAVLRAAELGGLEGIVAKRLDSPYRPGRRSPDWTKVALVNTQEVLVIGWKPGEGRRAGTIGSLLLAVYDPADRLVFAGHVGTGFSDAALRTLQRQLEPLARSTAPITGVPREHARYARWVEPALVGEVTFRTWTPEGRLRHASWRGLRTDRSPISVRRAPVPERVADEQVEGSLQTPDGAWQVVAVRRGGDRFYRLIHAGNVLDGLDLAAVEQALAAAGIGMDELRAAA